MSLLIGIPSTTYSGWLFPSIDEYPLIITLADPPIVPLFFICAPATWPDNELIKFTSFIVARLSPSIVWVAYPRDFLSLEIPKAVTTTSSIIIPSVIVTFTEDLP